MKKFCRASNVGYSHCSRGSRRSARWSHSARSVGFTQTFSFSLLYFPFHRHSRVKYNFAQVQHNQPCRHLFLAHVCNFVQPVLLPITFGLSTLQFTLWQQHARIVPGTFFFWLKVLHFYTSHKHKRHCRPWGHSSFQRCGHGPGVSRRGWTMTSSWWPSRSSKRLQKQPRLQRGCRDRGVFKLTVHNSKSKRVFL